MSRLSLIIKREYVQMVCKKSFIFTTLLVPVLSIILCGVLPVLLSRAKSDDRKVVAVIDQSLEGAYASCLQDDEDYIYHQITVADTVTDMHKLYQESTEELYALVVIPVNLEQSANVSIFSEKSVNGSLERSVSRSLREAVRQERIKAHDIENLEAIIQDCDPEIKTTNIKWSKEGEEKISSSELSMVLGLMLAMLTYMFVIIYGALIMNSVVEEKTNRIVEVIVSTCKPFELMMGKIIGVALVGLTQISLWSVILGIIGTVFGISAMATSMPDMAAMQANSPDVEALLAAQGSDDTLNRIVQMVLNVNYTQILICFVLYFIGGYLLYASLFAAFGSAVDQASDASQFTAPIMMIMIFALYAGMFSMENPDGPLAFWCSIIPFTSPVVMMIRLPYDLPWYELVGSLVLLYATALGILWLSARIYRTGILMYGRKFTFKEIVRWIK